METLQCVLQNDAPTKGVGFGFRNHDVDRAGELSNSKKPKDHAQRDLARSSRPAFFSVG